MKTIEATESLYIHRTSAEITASKGAIQIPRCYLNLRFGFEVQDCPLVYSTVYDFCAVNFNWNISYSYYGQDPVREVCR